MKRNTIFNRLDQYLLRNFPAIWNHQLHRLLPIICITTVVIFLFLLLQSPQTYSSNDWTIVSWLYVVALAVLIIWLAYVMRFNAMKSFGVRPKLDGLKDFSQLFVGVALISSIPAVFFMARSARTHLKFEEKELVNHINNINLGLGLNHELEEDSSMVVPADSMRYRDLEVSLESNSSYYDSIYLDPETRIYHCYNLHHFNSIQFYYSVDNGGRGVYEKIQVFQKLNQLKTFSDTMEILTNLVGSLNAFKSINYSAKYLYGWVKDGEPVMSWSDYESRQHDVYLAFDQVLTVARYNLEFFDAFSWYRWRDILHADFYAVFFMSLLIFIFRNMTIKTFLISVGVGALLPFLVVLIVLAIDDIQESTAYVVVLSIYILAWLLFLFATGFKSRTLFSGILLNLLTVSSPLLGVLLATWWIKDYERSIPYDQVINDSLIDQVLLIGEIGGMVLFIALLQPVFRRFYVQWYALPEE